MVMLQIGNEWVRIDRHSLRVEPGLAGLFCLIASSNSTGKNRIVLDFDRDKAVLEGVGKLLHAIEDGAHVRYHDHLFHVVMKKAETPAGVQS